MTTQLSDTATKYLHKATTNKPGRWLSIALQNLAAEMLPDTLSDLIPLVQKQLLATLEERLAKLESLQAPQCLLDNQRRINDKVKSGKDERVRILTRQLERLTNR